MSVVVNAATWPVVKALNCVEVKDDTWLEDSAAMTPVDKLPTCEEVSTPSLSTDNAVTCDVVNAPA